MAQEKIGRAGAASGGLNRHAGKPRDVAGAINVAKADEAIIGAEEPTVEEIGALQKEETRQRLRVQIRPARDVTGKRAIGDERVLIQ